MTWVGAALAEFSWVEDESKDGPGTSSTNRSVILEVMRREGLTCVGAKA